MKSLRKIKVHHEKVKSVKHKIRLQNGRLPRAANKTIGTETVAVKTKASNQSANDTKTRVTNRENLYGRGGNQRTIVDNSALYKSR